MAEPPGVRDGITGVEIGGFVGAPYAARCLADLGATVSAITCAGDDDRRRLGRAMGKPAWTGAPRFASHSGP